MTPKERADYLLGDQKDGDGTGAVLLAEGERLGLTGSPEEIVREMRSRNGDKMPYLLALARILDGKHYMHRPSVWGTRGPVVVLKDGVLWIDNPRWESGRWESVSTTINDDMAADDWVVAERASK